MLELHISSKREISVRRGEIDYKRPPFMLQSHIRIGDRRPFGARGGSPIDDRRPFRVREESQTADGGGVVSECPALTANGRPS